jgi:SNF2 family DNA or RNA helicase
LHHYGRTIFGTSNFICLQLKNNSGKANPCLLITTYGLLKTNLNDCSPILGDSKRFWDYVILDEGQCIKNSTTQQHKSCSRVAVNPQTRRLLLTGTPIQNNLTELWSLFDWTTSGKLLGKLQT